MERSYEEEWFEETNIGRKIKEFLEKDSWKIEKFNENKKQQGPDIVATKNGKKIVIEVKGYPPRYYVVGKKKGQPKPTHPNLEAKHWFADALLSVVVEKSRNPKIKVGIGLPLFPKMRN